MTGSKVLFVTPEFGDYVKSGGLGEVSAALPRALRRRCDVRILIPGYRQILERHGAIEVVARLEGFAGLPPCSIGRLKTTDGLNVYAVLCDELYDRPGSPYGDLNGVDFPDNDIRFARLSAAAADIASGKGDPTWQPDVIHVNDWPAALTPAYLNWRGVDTPTILTIHNLAYQGLFTPDRLDLLGIPHAAYQIDGVEFHGKLSFLKGGIFYANHLTTVSETYAREITQPEFGCGLDGLLAQRARSGRVSGILNGIEGNWEARDHAEMQDGRFNASRWKTKQAEKLRRMFDLQESGGPLFAIVSRLVHQKGLDVAIDSAEDVIAQGGQIVVTGRGEPRLENAMLALADRYPKSVAVRIGFDDTEARQIFAGSDFLIMPSRFEPCGLSQMYAQKFGALPIAHRTGGLADTIDDGKTGFLFNAVTKTNLKSALKRALGTFGSKQDLQRMRQTAMRMNFAWGRSAALYNQVYKGLTSSV